MAKALVIKGVDFSANRLDVVTLENPKPCTGITLNKNTITFTALGSSETITPTVTPADTTDTVLWVSSNNNIATVVNGVVTQTGVGTTTITAICGTYSATCEVTATNVLTFTASKGNAMKKPSDTSTYDYCTIYTASSYGVLYNSTSSTPYVIYKDSPTGIDTPVYPIRLGGNAGKINITGVPTNVRVTVWQVNCDQESNYGASHPTSGSHGAARYVSSDANSYDSNVPTGTDRIVNVASGANAAVFAMQHYGGSVSDSDIAAITITVTAS